MVLSLVDFNTNDFLDLFEKNKLTTDFDRSRLILVAAIPSYKIEELTVGTDRLVNDAKHFVIMYYVGSKIQSNVKIEYYSVKLFDNTPSLIWIDTLNYIEDIPRDTTLFSNFENALKKYMELEDLSVQHMYIMNKAMYELHYTKSKLKNTVYYDVYIVIGAKQQHIGVEIIIHDNKSIEILNVVPSSDVNIHLPFFN